MNTHPSLEDLESRTLLSGALPMQAPVLSDHAIVQVMGQDSIVVDKAADSRGTVGDVLQLSAPEGEIDSQSAEEIFAEGATYDPEREKAASAMADAITQRSQAELATAYDAVFADFGEHVNIAPGPEDDLASFRRFKQPHPLSQMETPRTTPPLINSHAAPRVRFADGEELPQEPAPEKMPPERGQAGERAKENPEPERFPAPKPEPQPKEDVQLEAPLSPQSTRNEAPAPNTPPEKKMHQDGMNGDAALVGAMAAAALPHVKKMVDAKDHPNSPDAKRTQAERGGIRGIAQKLQRWWRGGN